MAKLLPDPDSENCGVIIALSHYAYGNFLHSDMEPKHICQSASLSYIPGLVSFF